MGNNPTDILLVIGIDAVGPARLPRLLHDAGCHVSVLCYPRFAVRRSRFVDHHLAAPDEAAALAETLRGHLANHAERYRWVLLGDETILRSVAARYEEDWTAICLPVPRTASAIKLITDKLTFLAAATASGLPVPEHAVCSTLEEFAKTARTIRFPLMIKRGEGMAGSGVHLVATPEVLQAIGWECTPETPLAVQRYVEGDVGSSEVLFDHGRLVAWSSSYHREFWPTPLTASCVRELAIVPEVESMLLKIGEMTAFHGLAGVDWLRDRTDGRIYLIEFNPRPTPCYHLGPRVGVDFARALRHLLGGQSEIQRPRIPSAGQSLVYQFPQYCYRAIDDRAFHRIWRTRHDVPWNDPMLVAAQLRRVMTHYLPSDARKALRAWRTAPS